MHAGLDVKVGLRHFLKEKRFGKPFGPRVAIAEKLAAVSTVLCV